MEASGLWVYFLVKKSSFALAGVAQLVGASFCNPKVVGSVAGQGTYLGCRFDPWSRTYHPLPRHVQKAAN